MSSSINSRLFIVAGSSQLLFLSASLLKDKDSEEQTYNDVLIFRGTNIDSSRRTISHDIAKKVWNWSSIIWLDDIGYYESKSKKESLKQSFVNVKEIWVCMPYGQVEQEISIMFPKANIVFFDDGLGSYTVPNSLKEYIDKPSFIKKKVLLYLKRCVAVFSKKSKFKKKFFPKFNHAKRYMLFSEFFDDKENSDQNIIVDWSYLKAQISKCSIAYNPKLDVTKKKKCLILGQYFSLHGELTREEELIHYSEICKTLESEGYTILWKEHPKNPEPFFKDLSKQFNTINNLNEYYNELLPVELLAENLSVDLYLASTSTSLIILNKAFGFKILSSAPLLEDKMSGADKVVASFMIKNLKKEQLLESI